MKFSVLLLVAVALTAVLAAPLTGNGSGPNAPAPMGPDGKFVSPKTNVPAAPVPPKTVAKIVGKSIITGTINVLKKMDKSKTASKKTTMADKITFSPNTPISSTFYTNSPLGRLPKSPMAVTASVAVVHVPVVTVKKTVVFSKHTASHAVSGSTTTYNASPEEWASGAHPTGDVAVVVHMHSHSGIIAPAAVAVPVAPAPCKKACKVGKINPDDMKKLRAVKIIGASVQGAKPKKLAPAVILNKDGTVYKAPVGAQTEQTTIVKVKKLGDKNFLEHTSSFAPIKKQTKQRTEVKASGAAQEAQEKAEIEKELSVLNNSESSSSSSSPRSLIEQNGEGQVNSELASLLDSSLADEDALIDAFIEVDEEIDAEDKEMLRQEEAAAAEKLEKKKADKPAIVEGNKSGMFTPHAGTIVEAPHAVTIHTTTVHTTVLPKVQYFTPVYKKACKQNGKKDKKGKKACSPAGPTTNAVAYVSKLHKIPAPQPQVVLYKTYVHHTVSTACCQGCCAGKKVVVAAVPKKVFSEPVYKP